MSDLSIPGSRLPSDPDDLEPPVLAFRLILMAALHLRGAMDDHLRPAGLTTQQASLMTVIESGTATTLVAAADALGTSHQNVRQIADGLVRKNLIEISADPSDGRRRIMTLTQQAQRFWRDRSADDADVVAQWFGQLTRAEQQTLSGLLTRVIVGTP